MKALTLSSVCIVIIGLALSGCSTSGSGASPNQLPSVEIREYQGENLSSIQDFRENSIKGPQVVDEKSYRLEVAGLVASPRSYSLSDAIAHPNYSKVVTLHCVEGWDAKVLWEGIRLKDLFDEVGVDAKANTVIFHAYDGYTTSLPLRFIIDRDIILAHEINGVTLPPERGFPFQLVAEDKWGYKWIKWVTKIELSDNPNYRGYWEQRGYSNQGDYGQEMFD